jgi:AcrR family transcriptional regulator
MAKAPAGARRPLKKGKSAPRVQLTPDDWVSAATALLVKNGVDAVRVDVLAKQLNVTRGSFYYHFADRDALLRSMLTAWRDAATDSVITRFEQKGTEPRELLRDLLTLPFRGRIAAEAAAVELAIRGWARRDEMARRNVDEVDTQRLSYIARCFSAIGLTIAEARVRAFALYGYELAESLLGNQGTPRQKRERRQFMERALLQGVDP